MSADMTPFEKYDKRHEENDKALEIIGRCGLDFFIFSISTNYYEYNTKKYWLYKRISANEWQLLKKVIKEVKYA